MAVEPTLESRDNLFLRANALLVPRTAPLECNEQDKRRARKTCAIRNTTSAAAKALA
jgi:hypothetical protein